MSSGHFSRTNRNQPQKTFNKSQQLSQISTNPSQITNKLEESATTGYVYKPPTKIARTNAATNPIAKQEPKTQQKPKIQPNKLMGFVKKPIVTESPQRIKTEPAQQIIEVNPTQVTKPISRLANKNTDLFGLPVVPKKQQPILNVNTKSIEPLPNKQTKLTTNLNNNLSNNKTTQGTTSALKRGLMQQLNNAKSMPVLDLKNKPVNPYTYPKKITPRGSEKFENDNNSEKNKQCQVRQQTPKFSRTTGVSIQEKLNAVQNTQANKVGYSYQRKNVQTVSKVVQFTESSSNSKGVITSVQSLAKKSEQGQKQITVPAKSQQSPTKSSVSQTAKYPIKVQQSNGKKQNQISPKQQQPVKKQIKRSSLLIYTLNKLYNTKLNSSWSHLSTFTKYIHETKQNQKLHQYFNRSLNNFIRNYEKQALIRPIFALIKSLYSKIVKGELAKAVDPKLSSILISNRNNCLARVLENILVSDQRFLKDGFAQLKKQTTSIKQKRNSVEYGAKVLGNLEFKKLKAYFSNLVQFSQLKGQSKNWILNRCSVINQNYKKNILRQSFIRICLNKLRQLSSTIKTNTTQVSKISSKPISIGGQAQQANMEQQSPIIKQIKQKIHDQQTKVGQLKQKFSGQPSQSDLRQLSKQLKQDKLRFTNQNRQKKQLNNEYKIKLQSLLKSGPNNRHQELESLSGNVDKQQSSTLSLLHEIYMKLYKLSEQQCTSSQNVNSLWIIHRVEQNQKQRENILKWLALQQNINLKYQIGLYEGNYTTDEAINSASGNNIILKKQQLYRKLEQQNEIVKKFIRSYIKERYMWQQVKQYVAGVINE